MLKNPSRTLARALIVLVAFGNLTPIVTYRAHAEETEEGTEGLQKDQEQIAKMLEELRVKKAALESKKATEGLTEADKTELKRLKKEISEKQRWYDKAKGLEKTADRKERKIKRDEKSIAEIDQELADPNTDSERKAYLRTVRQDLVDRIGRKKDGFTKATGNEYKSKEQIQAERDKAKADEITRQEQARELGDKLEEEARLKREADALKAAEEAAAKKKAEDEAKKKQDEQAKKDDAAYKVAYNKFLKKARAHADCWTTSKKEYSHTMYFDAGDFGIGPGRTANLEKWVQATTTALRSSGHERIGSLTIEASSSKLDVKMGDVSDERIAAVRKMLTEQITQPAKGKGWHGATPGELPLALGKTPKIMLAGDRGPANMSSYLNPAAANSWDAVARALEANDAQAVPGIKKSEKARAANVSFLQKCCSKGNESFPPPEAVHRPYQYVRIGLSGSKFTPESPACSRVVTKPVAVTTKTDKGTDQDLGQQQQTTGQPDQVDADDGAVNTRKKFTVPGN